MVKFKTIIHSKCNFNVIIKMSEKCILNFVEKISKYCTYVSSTNKRVISLLIAVLCYFIDLCHCLTFALGIITATLISPIFVNKPFLTVDANLGNQAFQNGRYYICVSLGLDKIETGYNLLMELKCTHQMLNCSYSHWFACS